MKLKIISIFLALFVLSSPAHPWVIQAGLAVASAISGFNATAPMTFDSSGNPKIPSGSRSMKVSLKGALTVAGAALFAASASSVSSALNGGQPFADSDNTTCQSHFGQSKTYIKESLKNQNSGYVFSNETPSGFHYELAGQAQGDVWGCSGVVELAADAMASALAANPSQSNTDALVSDVKAFAQSNPSETANIVQMDEGTMGYIDGVFYDNTGASNTITSDGSGNVTVNGSPVTTSPVNNAGGTLSVIESSASSKPIVDGNPVEGNSDQTGSPDAPSGDGGSTSSDMGAVVTAVNNLKNKNAQGSADVVSALNAVKGSVDSIQGYTDPCIDNPDRAGCQTLGSGSGAPSLSTETIDLGSALSPVDVGQGVGVCPDSMSSTYQGQALGFDFTKACSFLIDIRPVVLGMAWFTAALIFVGGVKTE